MWLYFWDAVLNQWDTILSSADSVLASIGGTPWTFGVIPSQYAWILGATGIVECLTMVATALGIRFLLQSVPFVRWGS